MGVERFRICDAQPPPSPSPCQGEVNKPGPADGFGEVPGGAKSGAGDRAVGELYGKLLLDEKDDLHDRHRVQPGREEVGIEAERLVGFQQVAADVVQEAGGDPCGLFHQ